MNRRRIMSWYRHKPPKYPPKKPDPSPENRDPRA